MRGRWSKLLLIVLLLLVPLSSVQGAGKLVAAVLSSDQPRYREAHKALVKTLASKGFDHNNLEIVLQNPNPDPISWANSIRKANAIGADVMVIYGAPATLAAVRESTDVPVVFVDVYGPVDAGISRSMTTAGPHVTGVSSKVPMATLLSAFLGIKPVKTVGVVYSSREIGSIVQLKEIKRMGVQYGFNVVEVNAVSTAGLENLVTSLLGQVGCLYVSECSAGCKSFERIAQLAHDRKIPVLSQMPDAAEKGALMSLEVNTAEQGQMAGDYAAKILGGKNPGQLPIQSPKKVDLVINMKVAKSLDLNIPFQVLGQATKLLK